jgi:TP901 family phage tail tape measure protein
MATSVGDLTATLGLNYSSFSTGLKSAGNALQSFSGSIEKAGKKMTMGITVPLAASAAGAITAAGAFDSSMSKIQGLVGATTTEMGHLKKGVLDLAGQTAKAPGELSEALFSLKSAGLDSTQSMQALELAAKASAAGLGDTQAVALTTASAMTAYRDSGLTAAQATDILVATVREGNLSAEELASSLSQILPIASNAGVGLEEVGASVAIITRSGASASEAVTGMRAALLALHAPTGEAQKLFEEAGISADTLRKTLAEDGVIAALKMVEQAADGDASKMRLMLGSMEALNAAAVLLGTEASTLSGVFDGVANSTGSLDAAFAVASDTAAFKFKAALQEMQATAIKFGEIMLPVATAVLDFVNVILDGFGKIPEPIKRIIVVFGTLAAAMGPVLIVGAKLLGLLSKVSLATQATGLAMSVLGDHAPASLGRLNTGFERTQGALTKVTAGFGAVTAALGVGLVAYTAYTTAMDIANQAKARAAERAEALTAALEDLTRSYRENSAAVLENMDVGADAADVMERLRISSDDIAAAAAGGTDAFQKLGDANGLLLISSENLAAALDEALATALAEGDEKAAAFAQRLIEMNNQGRITAQELKAIANATDELGDAGDDWLEKQRELTSETVANEAALRGWNLMTAVAVRMQYEAATSAEEWHNVQRAVADGFFDIEGAAVGSTASMNNYVTAQQWAADGAVDFDLASMGAAGSIEAVATAADEAEAAANALAEAERAAAVAADQAAISFNAQMEALDAANRLDDTIADFLSLESAIKDTADGVDSSLSEIIASMRANNQAVEDWRANLVTIAERAGDGFAAEIAQLGPEYAGVAAQLASASDEEMAAFIEEHRRGGQLSREGLGSELSQVRDMMVAVMASAIREAAIIGQNIAAGLAIGLANGGGAAVEAAGSLANSIIDAHIVELQTNSPSKVTTQIGEWVAEGLVVGMANGAGEVRASAAQMAVGLVETMESMADRVNAAGGNLGKGAAKAIKESWAAATRDLRNSLSVQGFEEQIIAIHERQVAAVNEVQDAYHRAVDANEAVYRAELNLIEAKKEAVKVTDEEMRAISEQVSTVEDLERAYALAQAEVNAMLDSQRALTDMSLSSAMSQASLDLQIFKSQRKISDLGDEIDRAREKGEDFTEQSLELALEQLRVEEATRRLSVEQQTATTHADELSDAFSRQMQAGLDVKLAEEELARLREAAVGDTDAVREAEEDLRVKRLEAMKANQDYNAITATLAETQVQLQTDLIKVMLAIGDFIAQGGQWRSDLSLSGVATGALKDTALTNFGAMQSGGSTQMTTLKNNIQTQLGAAKLYVGNAVGAMKDSINGLPTSKTFTYKIVTDNSKFQQVQGVTTGGHNFAYYGSPQFPARANGGPVTAGKPYTVGERGIEVFVPAQSGKIIPNRQLATAGVGGTGPQVNVTINAGSVASEQQLRDQIVDAVRDAIRMNPDSLNP